MENKDTNEDYTAIWKILGVFFLSLLIIFFACCTSKKIQGYTKDVYDSLYANELEQKIRVLEAENGELTARVNELEYLGVVFDNDCDSVLKAALIKSGCNTDSINAILSMYKSKIKTYSDGTVEAEGFIKSLKRTKERNEEVIVKYQRQIDSLKEIKQQEINWVKTVTITKAKTVKRGWYWWVWVLIGYGICILMPPQRAWSYIKKGIAKIPS